MLVRASWLRFGITEFTRLWFILAMASNLLYSFLVKPCLLAILVWGGTLCVLFVRHRFSPLLRSHHPHRGPSSFFFCWQPYLDLKYQPCGTLREILPCSFTRQPVSRRQKATLLRTLDQGMIRPSFADKNWTLKTTIIVGCFRGNKVWVWPLFRLWTIQIQLDISAEHVCAFRS